MRMIEDDTQLTEENGQAFWAEQTRSLDRTVRARLLEALETEGEVAVFERLEKAHRGFHGAAPITLISMSQTIEKLVSLRDPLLVEPVVEAAATPADTRPRDPNTGRFLSEYEVWTSEPTRSMAEIRRRANADPDGYGAFFRGAYQQQILVDGGLRVIGAPTRQTTDADRSALQEFVKIYQTTPARQLRPLNGFVEAGGKRWDWPTFQSLVAKASDAGLL